MKTTPKIRHARLDVTLTDLFPRHKDIGYYEEYVCEAPSEEAVGHKWSTVTCEQCRAHPSFQRARKLFEYLYADELFVSALGNSDFSKCRIPRMQIYLISPRCDPDRVSEAIFEDIIEYALLPARYFIWLDDTRLKVNIEAWGSNLDGCSDIYYKYLSSCNLPFDLFRYGSEPSRLIEEVRSVDVMSGDRRAYWRRKSDTDQ